MDDSFVAIQQLLSENPDLADLGTPANAHLIKKAEQFLEINFDNAFRRYLSTWGTIAFGPLEFYGLIGADFENSHVPDAIWFTAIKRKQVGLPHELVVVFNNDGDEFYCVDSSNGKVVIWDVVERRVRAVKAENILDMIYREASSFLE